MVIVIEGIDRTGKGTLIKEIKKRMDIPVFKADRVTLPIATMDENNAVSYGYCMGMTQLFNNTYAKSKTEHIIVDRFHWTEYVYTLVERDRDVTNYYVKQIEKEMMKEADGYYMMWAMPVDISYNSRHHGRDLKPHQREYEKLFNNCQLPKTQYTIYSVDIVLGKVLKRLGYENEG